MTLYETLGVAADASVDAIRAAFRKLAHKHHPDKGGKVEDFQAVQKAYEVLGDPERRAQYDQTGQTEAQADPATVAGQQLGSLFMGAVDHVPDISCVDIVDLVRSKVQEMKVAHVNGLADVKARIAKREAAMKRLGNKAGVAHRALSYDLVELKKRLAAHEQAGAVVEAMFKLLKDESYEFAQPTQAQMRNPFVNYYNQGMQR